MADEWVYVWMRCFKNQSMKTITASKQHTHLKICAYSNTTTCTLISLHEPGLWRRYLNYDASEFKTQNYN